MNTRQFIDAIRARIVGFTIADMRDTIRLTAPFMCKDLLSAMTGGKHEHGELMALAIAALMQWASRLADGTATTADADAFLDRMSRLGDVIDVLPVERQVRP